jgi:cytochrome c-type biogenesis protein CcmH/NrfF
VLLALGLLLLVKNIRQRGRQSDTTFSQEEQARINALLGKDKDEERG